MEHKHLLLVVFILNSLASVYSDPTLSWTFNAVGWVNSPPVISSDNSIIYVVRDNVKSFVAVNATTGFALWYYSLVGTSIYSPALSNDDKSVFFGQTSDNTFGQNFFYSLNAVTGGQQWAYRTNYEVTSSPVLTFDDGLVFFTSFYMSSSGSLVNILRALNTSTGVVKWYFILGTPNVAKFYLERSSDDSLLYIGNSGYNNVYNNYILYCLRTADGTVVWSTVLNLNSEVKIKASFWGYHVFLIDQWCKIYALRPSDGSVIWQQAGSIYGSTAISEGYTAFGTIYYGNGNGDLVCLTLNGISVWTYRSGFMSAVKSVYYNKASDKQVYMVVNMYMLAIDIYSGRLVWSYFFKSDIPDVVTGRSLQYRKPDTLYVGSQYGLVYKFFLNFKRDDILCTEYCGGTKFMSSGSLLALQITIPNQGYLSLTFNINNSNYSVYFSCFILDAVNTRMLSETTNYTSSVWLDPDFQSTQQCIFGSETSPKLLTAPPGNYYIVIASAKGRNIPILNYYIYATIVLKRLDFPCNIEKVCNDVLPVFPNGSYIAIPFLIPDRGQVLLNFVFLSSSQGGKFSCAIIDEDNLVLFQRSLNNAYTVIWEISASYECSLYQSSFSQRPGIYYIFLKTADSKNVLQISYSVEVASAPLIPLSDSCLNTINCTSYLRKISMYEYLALEIVVPPNMTSIALYFNIQSSETGGTFECEILDKNNVDLAVRGKMHQSIYSPSGYANVNPNQPFSMIDKYHYIFGYDNGIGDQFVANAGIYYIYVTPTTSKVYNLTYQVLTSAVLSETCCKQQCGLLTSSNAQCRGGTVALNCLCSNSICNCLNILEYNPGNSIVLPTILVIVLIIIGVGVTALSFYFYKRKKMRHEDQKSVLSDLSGISMHENMKV